MRDRSAGSRSSRLGLTAAAILLATTHGTAEDRIVKPSNGDWIPDGAIEVIVSTAEGTLVLDGEPLEATAPFPGVLAARASLGPGLHVLALESDKGRLEVSFQTGEDAPVGDASPYAHHPPVSLACGHCHSVSRRGRFRFSGGCQSCHAEEAFIRVHSHPSHELASCGMCHDAHGSAEESLLAIPKEKACVQCHN